MHKAVTSVTALILFLPSTHTQKFPDTESIESDKSVGMKELSLEVEDDAYLITNTLMA